MRAGFEWRSSGLLVIIDTVIQPALHFRHRHIGKNIGDCWNVPTRETQNIS